MRYLIGILSGALLAILPPLLLALPDMAWLHACMSVSASLPLPEGAGDLVEDPCGLIYHRSEPLWLGLLMRSMLVIGCVVSGALAARIAERRRLVVGFVAPFLGYVVLIAWSDADALFSPLGVFVTLAAGLLGALGAGWRRLTSAWSAARTKSSTSQA